MQAFDKMSRGEVDAQTLGSLLNLNDRDFWKGALVGSAAVLLLSNLPALTSMVQAATDAVSGTGHSVDPDAAPETNSSETSASADPSATDTDGPGMKETGL